MEKRLPRLKELLSRLNNGIDVQRRDLKSVLTDSEWEEFNSWWSDEKDNRKAVPPKELVLYVKRKKAVALAHARYERYATRTRTKTNPGMSRRMYESADNAQDKLLEYLREQLSYDPTLMMWLVPVEPYGSVQDMLAANALPQVCTSRTVASDKRSPMGTRSKRDLKVQILEQAISSIEDKDVGVQVLLPAKTVRKRDFSGFKV